MPRRKIPKALQDKATAALKRAITESADRDWYSKDPKQQSEYERGLRDGRQNLAWRKAEFKQHVPGNRDHAVVNSYYLDGYLRGYAEAQVKWALACRGIHGEEVK